MINWFKKPKITFDCQIPGVERIMPIIPAKDYKHQWVERARHEFITAKKSPEWGMKKEMHTARCPGIFSLQRTGWLIRTWQDIVIETNGDGESFTWNTPIDQSALCPHLGNYVSAHSKVQLHDFMNNWPSNTLKTAIKIVNPWMTYIPKGYYLMEIPVAYGDENRFTALPGFASSEKGYTSLSTNLLWHVTNGKTLIKAGTPLVQIILVKQDTFDFDMKTTGTVSDAHFYGLSRDSKYVIDYNSIKKLSRETK